MRNGSGREMNASNARMRLPEAGCALRKQDGGSDGNPAARVTRMTAREERWRSGKEDERPEARMPVGEER
jgi:hypothetical protein